MVSSCALDADGMRRQLRRYREAGQDAVVLERTARRLVVRVAPERVGPVPELVAVETECCPFFDLSWEAPTRTFAVGVSRSEDEPALDAIAHALGV